MKASILLVASVVFSLSLLLCSDRLIGHLRPAREALLFPPGSRLIIQTSEFDTVAVVNSLGFRDREFAIQRNSKRRILAIGDSFTFGWGVNIGETWVKQLEGRLNNVEVANLGRGGSYPRFYADVAEKAIPLLSPDLVLVAVLQGDDLAQCGEEKLARQETASMRPAVARVVRTYYPNLLALARPIAVSAGESSQTSHWRGEVEQLIAGNPAKFEALDADVQGRYVRGDLNPGMLDLYIHRPARFSETMDLQSSDTKALIGEMATHLARIKRLAAGRGAQVLVVPVPTAAYINRTGWKRVRRLGFELTEDMLTSTAPDDAIRLACTQAGVSFASVTDAFRQRAQGDDFYFEFDSHFNRKGTAAFAELLAPVVESAIKERR